MEPQVSQGIEIIEVGSDQAYSREVMNWNDEAKMAEVKKIFAPKLTDTEFQAFRGIGRATGLNPFLREIWAVKYGDGAASIFIGRDGYRKSAQANSEYDWHFVDAIYANDSFRVVNGEVNHDYRLTDRGALIGAYALCKRKTSSRPNYGQVLLKEYTTGKSLWTSKPETMIKKVAEAQVLRMTFQELFAGTYDEAEQWDDKSGKIEKSNGFSNAETPKPLPTTKELPPKPIDSATREEILVLIAQLQTADPERTVEASHAKIQEAFGCGLEEITYSQAIALKKKLENAVELAMDGTKPDPESK